MVESIDRALSAAAQAAEHGADLVELRIDNFTDSPSQVVELLERCALPCILTCRLAREGGEYTGSEDDRLHILQTAANSTRPPAYIDVELQSSLADRLSLTHDTGLILSSHDFDSRPADLTRRVEQMANHQACRVIKLAWRARSLRDNLEAFEIIAAKHKPTIALCMGEAGLPSRVLARKFGALLTFASLDDQSATAPGQPTVSQLKDLYHWDAIGPNTRVYGVIGHPVAHSMSPAIHNAGFAQLGCDSVYLPLPIPPEYEHFKATVGSLLAMKELNFRGASVTIPHKQNLLRFVAEQGGTIDPLAQKIKAANTLTVDDQGHLTATNTDQAGALDALPLSRKDLANKNVLVLGAGGVARAVVAGLAACGANVMIHNRTPEKADQLAMDFHTTCGDSGKSEGKSGGAVVTSVTTLDAHTTCDILINCTSVGMHPNINETPAPTLPACSIVFDTIYNPRQTRLLREAQQAGITTINGSEMFLHQAAAQFTQWTHQPAPLKTFRQILNKQLT